MNKPLISVVITNYNYGQFIAKAIDSILNQTYPNVELIIINDGSTDNSDKIINEIISKNPEANIVYVNRQNRGVVYTRNEGLKLARGEYICYLDADDYFNHNYLSKSYKIAKEYDADVVYPNWHFVGDWLGRPDTNFPEFTPERLQLQELHVTPASLIRKAAVEGHRFEVEKIAEDWDFFIGLSLEGAKFKLAKDNFINYRIRKGTRSSQYDPREDTQHFVEILKKHKRKYGEKVIDPSRLVSLRHPNILQKILSRRLARKLINSLKNDGAVATFKKVLRRILAMRAIWKIYSLAINYKYQRIFSSAKIEKSPKAKLAVILHLYYPDLWPDIKAQLRNINVPFDMYVSVQIKHSEIALEKINESHQRTNILPLPNRGRDVLPFFVIAKKLVQDNSYSYFLKIHSKKSPHRQDGHEWLNSLLRQLVPVNAGPIIKTLENPNTGAIGPKDHVTSLSKYIGANEQTIRIILRQMMGTEGLNQIMRNKSKYPFFGGTMFWCRADYLLPLIRTTLSPADFGTENGQIDGTTAHAVERILGRLLHAVSGKTMYVLSRGKVEELKEKSYTASYKYVD